MPKTIYVLTVVDYERSENIIYAFKYRYQAINKILSMLEFREQIIFLSDGFARSFNYDIKSRPEYQERGEDFVYECDWDWEYEIREVELEEV